MRPGFTVSPPRRTASSKNSWLISDVDAGAVAGLAVGIHGAAVPHGLQRGDAGGDHGARGLAVECGDEPHAAGVVLGHVDAGRFQQGGVAAIGLDEFGCRRRGSWRGS
jgi:hypothetical protein